MFANNTAEILTFERNTNHEDVIKKILHIHKLLKDIAQYETNETKNSSKLNSKPANLESHKLSKIKELEDLFGVCLVAYECEKDTREKKFKILNQISSLLESYLEVFIEKKLEKILQFS